MDKMELVIKIGNEVCEGCGPNRDCGLELKDCDRISNAIKSVDEFLEQDTRLEKLQDKMHKIKNWINAYPVEAFPEPDLKKTAQVLKQHGMTLDTISASSMCHVLNGIKNIIET